MAMARRRELITDELRSVDRAHGEVNAVLAARSYLLVVARREAPFYLPEAGFRQVQQVYMRKPASNEAGFVWIYRNGLTPFPSTGTA